MRGIILIISVILLAALAAGVFIILQPHAPIPTQAVDTPKGPRQVTPIPSPEGPSSIGVGTHPWWKRYDTKGNLTSVLRASKYEPMPDGRWKLYDPEAEFYLHNGQVLRIRGKTGDVIMQEGLNRAGNVVGSANLSQQPRAGKLYDVVLEMSESDIAPKPTLTLTMNNASFESESVRIATEAYQDARGRYIAGEDVPVHVRGDDYEFDGYGLKLQYNDLNRRMEFLKIYRGERLLIKDPKKFLESKSTTAPSSRTRVSRDPVGDAIGDLTIASLDLNRTRMATGTDGGMPPLAWVKGQPLPGSALAAADRAGAGRAARAGRAPGNRVRRPLPPRPTTRPKRVPTVQDQVYRATFYESVRILQNDQQLADADEMQLLFVHEQTDKSSTTQPATQPATAPAIPDAAPRTPVAGTSKPERLATAAQPASAGDSAPAAPAASASPATRPAADQAKAKPTTSPFDAPLTVLWKGPLEILPISGDVPEGLFAGESIVRLIARDGRAVHVVRENKGVKNNLRCANLMYWTVDHRARLERGPNVPVEMFDDRGNNIVTEWMDLSQDEGAAQLGPGTAKMIADNQSSAPDASADAKPKPPMLVSWTDRCMLFFLGEDTEQIVIQRAELDGEVNIAEPEQLTMRADSLDLFFDTSEVASKATTRPSRNPPLQQLRANGGVHCVVAGPKGPAETHTVDCDNLDLLTDRTADGRLYAHTIVATGHVRAIDPDRELSAGLLSAVLGEPEAKSTTQPTTRPGQRDMMPGNLQRLIASDNVRVITFPDKNTAECSTLEIHNSGSKAAGTDRTTAILSSFDSRNPAKVTWKDGKGALTGPMITMVKETQELSVNGPGQMRGSYQPKPGEPEQPVEIAWTKGLFGRGDVFDAQGNVNLKTIDTDGSINTASGETITLATTRPTTRPTAQPSDGAVVAKSRSTTKPAGDFDVMADRAIASIELRGAKDDKARVESLLTTPKGFRHMQAAGQLIQFFQPDEAHKRLLIPSPGFMLLQDTRPPAEDKKEAADDPMALRGITVFKWDRAMEYDQANSQIILTGQASVGRQEAPKDDALEIRGEKIVATIEETAPTTQPTTRPQTTPLASTRPGGGLFGSSSRITLKFLHMEGSETLPVQILSGKLNVRTPILDYDPATHLLSLKGTEDNPVREYDEHGLEAATMVEATYNTVTERWIVKKLTARSRQ